MHGHLREQASYQACLVCRGSRLKPLRAYARAHLLRCRDCGLVFSGRRPSDLELDAYYRDYGHGWVDSAVTRRRYAELLDRFEPYRANNRILDMGCGAGFFLEEARRRGWEVHGTEFSAHAREVSQAKQIDVVFAPPSLHVYERGFFDVITAFEVFEHVRDPVAESDGIAHALRPMGLLYCTTPNFDSLSRLTLRDRWSVVAYPEHLVYYTPASLTRWLAHAGFDRLEVATTGISLTRLRQVVGPEPSAASGGESDDERIRRVIEARRSLRWAKATLNGGLSLLGVGDTLKASFRRH